MDAAAKLRGLQRGFSFVAAAPLVMLAALFSPDWLRMALTGAALALLIAAAVLIALGLPALAPALRAREPDKAACTSLGVPPRRTAAVARWLFGGVLAIGLLDGLVVAPLAMVPARSLGEVYSLLADAGRLTPGLPILGVWAVSWLAVFATIAAFPLLPNRDREWDGRTPRGYVVLVAAAAVAAMWTWLIAQLRLAIDIVEVVPDAVARASGLGQLYGVASLLLTVLVVLVGLAPEKPGVKPRDAGQRRRHMAQSSR
ncbi:hypothetical protein [Cryobacterium sp. BB307]|uniref:hypothetical protein n=1 Tax=Cryobacterium sp. BB307 TaxID=2716317 RepID=UPI001446FBA4|nr:hypothetical protein [Cryobacterium sp. BB307]